MYVCHYIFRVCFCGDSCLLHLKYFFAWSFFLGVCILLRSWASFILFGHMFRHLDMHLQNIVFAFFVI